MKNSTCSTLQAAGIAIACWLLPSVGLASVEVKGLYYDLDEAEQTAVVVANPEKYDGYVTIPEDITVDGSTYHVSAIADCAFIDCHDLEMVVIESTSLTSIGYSAFERCYSLIGIYFAEGLKRFGYEAFKDCCSLQRVELPETLKTIGDRSFLGCTGLTKINIPESVHYLGDQWVSGCPLRLLIAGHREPLSIKAGSFKGLNKEFCILCVPEGSRQDYQTANVWKTFPRIVEGVVEADLCGDQVIYYVTSDMTMTVTGTGAMWDFLEYLNERPVTELPIENLVVEEGVTYLGDGAFQNETLAAISIPNSVYSMGSFTFHHSKWYASQPDGLLYAGKVAYDLKGDAMEGKDVILEDGTLGIANSAFLKHSISSLFIPASLIHVPTFINNFSDGVYTKFALLSDVGSIVIDPENKVYDSRDNCNAIIESATNDLIVGSRATTIPEGVISIAPFALFNVTSVTFPASVTRVDNLAFTSKLIHQWALDDYRYDAAVSPIETIVMEGSTPPAVALLPLIADMPYMGMFDTSHFAGIRNPKDCTLYVPLGSQSDYMNADGWKDLNIVEYDPNVGPTAIESIRESNAASRQIFDLQGRRLNNASGHSIIIENGRKRIQR